MIRGIRGATTVVRDEEEEILDVTEELLHEMIAQNSFQAEDVAQVLITVTEDLSAAFPAKALRRFSDWTYVPVVCAREIPVPGSLEKCIRLLVTVNTSLAQDKINHVYLREATKLRPDLANGNKLAN
ncbi:MULTISPECIES: chorismate mutase [Alkalihalophilus]|uniref:chorismate mutase n=2 Tax=Alkalihalophilus pseudofirmus TaxID=79885 RepID=D3G054_ALKPO|nr:MULTISPECIES: chorismate mutase [Alkalihalophilus]ADC51139.1 chorismate mutase [Alkalihalophilus pseudofirmus OF4]MDV2884332.1 chorismate mutase [Alkalihalophilus pseudofirmus]MEC2070821.1 chorismate mutase [Alkalihalophilus marmarensis]MED1601510.1 chorismate mutase [Alkalihalophilus marmarensis]OLS37956.1 chorismate mutase [Alkalihalophilus pseudofirmus]